MNVFVAWLDPASGKVLGAYATRTEAEAAVGRVHMEGGDNYDGAPTPEVLEFEIGDDAGPEAGDELRGAYAERDALGGRAGSLAEEVVTLEAERDSLQKLLRNVHALAERLVEHEFPLGFDLQRVLKGERPSEVAYDDLSQRQHVSLAQLSHNWRAKADSRRSNDGTSMCGAEQRAFERCAAELSDILAGGTP